MTRGEGDGKGPRGGEKKGGREGEGEGSEGGKEGEKRGMVVAAVDIGSGGEGEQRPAVKEEEG